MPSSSDAASAALLEFFTKREMHPAFVHPRSISFLSGGPTIRLFISYSHDDLPLWLELQKHLALMVRTGFITTWHDRDIIPGGDWRENISANLERADIVLLLISASFVASDYCYDIELRRALERDREGAAAVLPVIVRPVDGWTDTSFGQYQALPTNGRAVTSWANRDEAWTDVTAGIRAVVRIWQSYKVILSMRKGGEDV